MGRSYIPHFKYTKTFLLVCFPSKKTPSFREIDTHALHGMGYASRSIFTPYQHEVLHSVIIIALHLSGSSIFSSSLTHYYKFVLLEHNSEI